MRNNLSILNVYKKKNANSELVTQLLYGDQFKKIKKIKDWLKIKNKTDNYVGFIKKKKFPQNHKDSHKISNLSANLYLKPKLKFKIKKKIYFGSRIKVIDKKGLFYKFDKLWIKKTDLKKIDYREIYIFSNLKNFLGIKYKWGGKTSRGIDCSALVQLFANYNGKFCPRDTKEQMNFFKRDVKLRNIKKNDLIFWKGHVAVATSKKSLIHAYGPAKKVVCMSIKKTIIKIKKSAKLKVLAIKRI